MTNEEAIKILRDTPIDIRSTREDDIHTLYATAHNMAIDALKQTAWIPVGERLPDENGLYLVTSNKWGEWEVFVEIFYDGEWVKAEPVAWMPLPTVYQGE